MKNLIIFGVGEQAEMAYYYFSNDSDYNVIAFTADKEYITQKKIFNLPVINFDELESNYPIDKGYYIFIAIGYNNLNKIRTQKYHLCKNKGYKIASYISTKANIFTKKIGENVFILEDNTIQPYVEIGNNVTIWSGNHIGHHSTLEDNCFITSHVVISGGCKVGCDTFIGVNATIRDHVIIGKSNIIGASSLILKNTEDNKVYMEKATEVSRVPSNRLRSI
ncbi:acetyltransferase [Francisella salina]|uniref:Transferase, putative n=1 Tax=Francisella salina TaxID=573569 RepID=A0ABN3ZTX2_FRAST|nr:acetyltransferase [Francisella salina]AEI35788.1 transferase, putative [Francisella salina]